MSCAYITDTANQIWIDLGSPTDMSVSYIQSKLSSGAFLGRLNVLLGTCYTLVNGDIVPALGLAEQGLYAMLFQVDYYTRKVNQLANGLGGNTVVSLAEDDRRIVFVNTVDKMRLYRDMQKQLMDQLDKDISAYRNDALSPQDVKFYNFLNGFYGCGGGYVGSG